MDQFVPGPMDNWAHSGPYTVTNTIYLGPWTTKTADHIMESTSVETLTSTIVTTGLTTIKSSDTMYLVPFIAKTIDHTSQSSSVPTSTSTVIKTTATSTDKPALTSSQTSESANTTVPRSTVSSDLKGSIIVPTTLATDSIVREAPSITSFYSLSTVTDSDQTHTITAWPQRNSTEEISRTRPTIWTTRTSYMRASTFVPSLSTLSIDASAGTEPTATVVVQIPVDPRPASAASRPKGSFNKLSIALLGLWSGAFVAVCL